MSPLILASQSAARAAILKGAGLDFVSMASPLNETLVKQGLIGRGAQPREIARDLAEEKAKAASLIANGLVIGADQSLDLEGRLFDKPQNLDDARAHLLSLRGRTHQLHSGLAVARAGELLFSVVETASLTMRAFSNPWLDHYLSRNGAAVLESVGAYKLEGDGVQLFERIEGDYFVILGLPLLTLLSFLRDQGALSA